MLTATQTLAPAQAPGPSPHFSSAEGRVPAQPAPTVQPALTTQPARNIEPARTIEPAMPAQPGMAMAPALAATPGSTDGRARLPLALLRDQRIRFLIVGGINTLLGYGLFVLFYSLIGESIGRFGYLLALASSYAIGIFVAFGLHRRFVFKVRGRLLLDFGRFVVTNLVGIGLNFVLLPLMVTTTGLAPIIAQAITAVIVAVSSFFLHKYFSFRRAPDSGPAGDPTDRAVGVGA